MNNKKVLIVGLGLIGKMHANFLRNHFKEYELFALRSQSHKPSTHIKELYSWEEVDQHSFLAAFICNPTNQHISTSIECAKRGMHLFIEKPLDCNAKEFEELKKIIRKQNLATYVAYCQRFNPVISYLKETVNEYKPLHCRMITTNHLPSWRPDIDSKLTYSASKSKGGGVIFDLSHEIDMSNYIFGDLELAYKKAAKLGSVTLDSVDTADMILKAENCLISIHLNYFGHIAQRQIQVDFETFSLLAYTKESRIEKWVKREMVEEIKFSEPYEQMYIDQISHFFKNLTLPSEMNNNIFEAKKTLDLLIKINK